jgi:hypothetical protein
MIIDFGNIPNNKLAYIPIMFNVWNNTNGSNINSTIIKICLFKKEIRKNGFISDEIKCLTFDYLDSITKIHILKKKYYNKWLLAYINNKQCTNTHDFELNLISDHKSNIVYLDIHNKRKYVFTEKDFKKMVKTNLEHSYVYDAVPDPIPIKNPYTNELFTNTSLIEINNKLTLMPLIWHMYRETNYNMARFKQTFVGYLLVACIPSFIDQLENDDISFYLEDMFNFFEDIMYCSKCVQECRHFRSKIVRTALIKWIYSLKIYPSFKIEDLHLVKDVYKIPCVLHSIKSRLSKPINKFTLEYNIQFTGGPLTDYIFKAEYIPSVSSRKNKKCTREISKYYTRKYKKVLKRRKLVKNI